MYSLQPVSRCCQDVLSLFRYQTGWNLLIYQAEKRNFDFQKSELRFFISKNRLFVDESQNYKNLYLYTKMRNVAGLSTSEAQKSSDMFGKCRYLDEVTGGRGVIFATGTPISNSMTEMYTLMRYLQYSTLQQKQLTHFDWRNWRWTLALCPWEIERGGFENSDLICLWRLHCYWNF